MQVLIQRVTHAKVEVLGQIKGEINEGLLVFIGIEKNDEKAQMDKMLKRILGYRIFNDNDGKMNLSVMDIGANILAISQFTLAADTNCGTRAGFSTAKTPTEAEVLYQYFLTQLSTHLPNAQSGIFGADMQVSLTNDGPITFLLKC
jgi:D-tyrosyl-tRNA(Tyr) deacylase